MSNKNYDEFLQWLNEKEAKERSENNTNFENEEIKNDQDLTESEQLNQDQDYQSFIEDKNTDTEKFENEEINYEQNYSQEKLYKRNKLNEVDNKIYVDKEYVDQQIKNSRPKFRLVKATALVLIGALLGSLLGPLANNVFFQKDNTSGQSNSGNNPVNITTAEEVNVENAVAQKAIPSVVGIHTSFQTENPMMFGMPQYAEGIGSGVIVSSDGYILTNAHVVGDNPEELTVVFSDNSKIPAKVVYLDETLDLAVIKVEKDNLPAITFANSDEVKIGDKAIAIGNPLGLNLQSTLTSGYISGLDRTITMQDGLSMNGLIQTDASINSGNSGGALLNSQGMLIGINTAKAGSSDGIGFAIPSNIAKNIVEQIIEQGSFSPIILGIRGMDLSIYKQYPNVDIDRDEGVFIADVVSGSSADKSGIKVGDIILEINGETISSMNNLKQTLIKHRIGDNAKIKLLRDKEEIEVDIKFEGESPNI